MDGLICLFGKWYRKEELNYKTLCTNGTDLKMAREEEILNAARTYNNSITLASPSNVLHFEAGAKWADKHPNLDSLWHEPSEEPKDETHILIEYDYLGSKELLSYNIGDGLVNWERLKKNCGISRWAYISDILPKGGGK